MNRQKPINGELYYHFKGKMYQIVGVAIHSETREELVIYQALYGDFKIYARPLEMFMSEVDSVKYPDVKQRYRFTRVKVDEFGNKSFIEEDFSKNKNTTIPNVIVASATVGADINNNKETPIKELVEEVNKNEEPKFAINTTSVVDDFDDEKAQSFKKSVIEVSTNVGETDNKEHEFKNNIEKTARRKSPMFDYSKRREEVVEDDYVVPEGVNPKLIEFLDSDSYEERYNILVSLRDEITDKLVDDIAVSIDVVIPEGPLWQRYDDLKSALRLRQKYEFANRLRR
ncbi:Protein of unknown function [Lachnobacterium bovis DSM 14045]|uniref:DUF1653 domain-containing protein n=1 Tax=Lachnobacterium bovis DSM 14045 TaxID=1122142 RepID=A0A1H3LYB5_9FIRM|nr:DUF1653 domain-containing protein [Lachnobacterium bovis]SDY69431.1 Protein of unknown function [Lachnobacterium bovis DSM 14045]